MVGSYIILAMIEGATVQIPEHIITTDGGDEGTLSLEQNKVSADQITTSLCDDLVSIHNYAEELSYHRNIPRER